MYESEKICSVLHSLACIKKNEFGIKNSAQQYTFLYNKIYFVLEIIFCIRKFALYYKIYSGLFINSWCMQQSVIYKIQCSIKLLFNHNQLFHHEKELRDAVLVSNYPYNDMQS